MARINRYTERRRKGIVTPYGQWLYPGKVTTIPGNNITMQGVPYPVLGVSDKGDTKMMMPGMDYQFKGNEVTEYPVMQRGGFGRKRVEKNGMEYLQNTDGYTGVVQKQTQHGLGVSRRYDAPVYQYYNNGNPVGESWKGAGSFQNDIVKDYESEPVVPFSRKYSNYDPNSLTFFKDLATGETPFKPYEMTLGINLMNTPIGNGISQSVTAHSVPTDIPPAASPANTVLAYNEPSYFLAGQQMNKNKPYTASTSGIYASKWPTRDAAISNGVENGSSQQAFFEDLFKAITDYMKGNGIDESVGRPVAYDIVAHHTMESSSGGRLPAPFNYGGVRIPGSEDYKSFNDMNDYVKYYFENTVGGRNVFEQAMKGNAMSLEDYMRMLKDNGYFEADLDTYTANTRKDGYARAQKYLDDISYQTGGKIHIKEKNRGKFTEAAQRAGKSVQAYAAQILANKENYSPTLVKRANFARNAAKWKHQEGGDAIKKYLEGNYLQPKTIDSVMGAWNDQLAKGFAKGDMIANHVGNALNAAATASAAVATQFGKNFTKDIMAGQRNKQTSAIASNFEVQENPNAAPLYWPSEQNNNIQPLNNGYYGFPVIDNGESPYKSNQRVNIRKNSSSGDYWNNYFNQNNEFDRMDYLKFATGGSSSTPAEIERGEIVSTPTGDSIANGLMDYHELFSNRNEKKKNIVKLTNDMGNDVQRNPQLTPVTERINKYTAMRRNGKTFIFPSTVGRDGEILEPKNGNFYWLAKTINKK